MGGTEQQGLTKNLGFWPHCSLLQGEGVGSHIGERTTHSTDPFSVHSTFPSLTLSRCPDFEGDTSQGLVWPSTPAVPWPPTYFK